MTLPSPPASPLDLFLSLVRIPSPSQREGRLAAEICAWLEACSIPYTIDGSSAATGSDTGNIIARSWRSAERPTVLFLAHMDTVEREGSEVHPIVCDDGAVRSSGDTILGADNKAAVAAVLSLLANGRVSHANAIVVFTTCEERGRMGVTALGDLAREVDLAFPIDGSYPVGTVLEAALGQVPFDLRVHGREAHAARDPDKGIHAIKAACEIVAGLQMGWADCSVLNVSEIRGGGETNIVPGFAEIRGEVRAFERTPLEARLERVQATARRIAASSDAGIELILRPEDGAPPFPPSEDGRCLAVAGAAAADIGVGLVRQRCVATLEANFVHGMGLATLGIASGGRRPHSVTESLPRGELDRLVGLLDAILTRAADIDPKRPG